MLDAGGIKATLTVDGLRKFKGDMDAAGDSMELAGKKGVVAAAGMKATGKEGAVAGAAVKRAAVGGFLAAGAAAVVSVKQFASFDDALNRVQINSGASSKQMEVLEKSARKMGEKFPASAVEVADAMNEILKAGMSVDDMLSGGLENSLAMATAESMEMAASAGVMSQAMSVFAIEGKDANKVTAALSNVASATSADVNDLALSLGQVGGTAAQAGMSVGDTSAALGVLVQNGLDGSKAGTALNSMLLSLRAPTASAAAALKDAGVQVYDATGKMRPFRDVVGSLQTSLAGMSSDQERANFLQKAFGVDAQQAASILTKQLPLYDSLAAKTKQLDAPVQKARDQMKSLGMQLDTTGESLGNMAMQVGGALAPAVAAALPHVQSMASAVGSGASDFIEGAGAAAKLASAAASVAISAAGAVPGIKGMGDAASQSSGMLTSMAGGAAASAGAFALTAVAASKSTSMIKTMSAAARAHPVLAIAVTGVAALGAAAGAMKSLADLGKPAQAALGGTGGAFERIQLAVSATGIAVDQLNASLSSLEGKKGSFGEISMGARVAANNLALAEENLSSVRKTSGRSAAQVTQAELLVEGARNQSTAATKKLEDAGMDLLTNQSVLNAQSVEAYKLLTTQKGATDALADAVEGVPKKSKTDISTNAPKTKAQVDSVAAAAHAIPGITPANVDTDAPGATGKLNAAAGAANAIPSNVNVTVTATLSGFSGAIASARSMLNSLQSKVVTVSAKKMATGGRVYGPGTGTSDSVPAMLSAGEWVLTEAQAKGIGYQNLANLPKFAKGGAAPGTSRWFDSKSSSSSASMQTGSAYWKAMESAGRTDSLGDDVSVISRQLKTQKAMLAAVRGQAAAGKGDAKAQASSSKQSAARQIADTVRDLTARLWQIRNVDGPNRVRDAKQRSGQAAADKATAGRQAAAQGVGAAGTASWKQSQAAGATESLDDDLASLQDQHRQLVALKTPEGTARAGEVANEIWTMLNVTMPQQQAASMAAAVQASIAGVGARGSDMWKHSSMAAATDTLDDDMAMLQWRLRDLQAIGPAAAEAIADTEADIWTMLNISMPQQALAKAIAGVGAKGSAMWAQSSLAAATDTLDDDMAMLQWRLRDLQAIGPAAAEQIANTQADIWTMLNISMPAQATAKAIAGVGAKGSDMWKRSSLAATTDTLDDDMAILQERVNALRAIGPAAADQIADAEADIWTMLNVTMPEKDKARQDQREQWERDAASAMSRGFYASSGGAGGGGNVGTTESTGGTSSGVGHHPRPEIDRVWLDGVQVNDLDARESVGVEITEILGWDEAEDFESVRTKRADGDALGGTRDGSVQLVVKGRLRGSTYADYHARRRALKAIIRAAADEVVLKVPDVTHGASESDYTDTYADSGMAGYERRSVRLTSNLTWGDEYGLFGSEFTFTLRSPQRFVVSDGSATAPSGDNAAAMSTSGDVAATTVLAIRGEVAAAPALDASRAFVGSDISSAIAVVSASSDGSSGGSPTTIGTLTATPQSVAIGISGSAGASSFVASKLANPASLPAGTGLGAAFDPSGTYLVTTGTASPYVAIYKRSGDEFAKLPDPATLPTGTGWDATFSPDGTYLVVAHGVSPYITIYKRSGDTFIKLANPASLPAGSGQGVTFTADGVYLAVAHTSSPHVTIYKRSGDVFTKLADPASLPASNARGAAFDPSGTYLVVANETAPSIIIYKRSGDVFTKLSDPASLPGGNGQDAAFSPDGTYLAVAHTSSPYVTIYKRSGDVFTKLADPASPLVSGGWGIAFDPSGVYLSVADGSSPYVAIYKRSGDTFAKLSNPATLPTGSGWDVAFDPSGTYLAVAHATSPYITIYAYAMTSPANGASLPVASADIAASGNLTARDAFDLDTIAQTATPKLRTPLARLLGGGTMLTAMLPTRSAKNDYTLSSVIGASPRVADAIAAIGALAVSGSVVNETGSGWNTHPGNMPLADTDNTVTTALAGWRCKLSGSNFTQNGYALRRLDATLGEPNTRPVMHVALIAPPTTWATTETALGSATGIKFAAYLSAQATHSAVVRNTSVGLYHDGTRMVPGILHARTATARVVRFSGANAVTPDPALHVWAAVIIDAGEIHHSAIALLDIYTGEPIMWISHSMSVLGTASTEQTDASQATTVSGTPTLTDAYVAGSQRNVGIGGTAATIQLSGIATSAAGHSGIVTLDALGELAPYGVNLAGASSGLQSRTALGNIARVVREWIGDRFAPQTITGQPLALGVEWTDREPAAHGEPYVRLDSIIATDVEQALGKSRTGGLSTEHMSTAGARGVGATPIEARRVR